MKKIVVLFIDAFSHSYINKKAAPFLSKQEVYSLTPLFGFKQLAAAFTGRDPLSTGLFAEHYYDPKHSPHKWTGMLPSPLLSIMDILPRTPINIFSRGISHHKKLSSKLVPLEFSRFFAIDGDPFPDSSPITSLLREKGLSYRFVFFPEVKTNEAAFDLLKALCNPNQRPDFLLVHFPELDSVTHQWGVRSSQRRNLVSKTDLMIAKATEMLSKDSYVIIFSDHGMLNVRGHIDIASKIKTLGCLGEDFIVFLDSIMARFWIFKDSIFETIIRLLSEETSGTITLPKKSHMIDKFGDIMFLCSPGYIVFPNYYDAKPPKAMHGYAPIPQNSPLNGIFLASDLPTTLTKERLSMTDVAFILKQTINSL